MAIYDAAQNKFFDDLGQEITGPELNITRHAYIVGLSKKAIIAERRKTATYVNETTGETIFSPDSALCTALEADRMALEQMINDMVCLNFNHNGS